MVTGEVISAGTLVDARRWSIELPRTGADATLLLRVDGALVAEVSAGPLRPGDHVRLVADPVVGELSVTTASGTVLFDPEVPDPADVLTGVGLRTDPVSTSRLCESLVALR